MLDTVCPRLPSQEGCFRTSRELPRHVGRLASPDKSESHGPQPAERQARDGAGWRRRRSGSDTDDARGGDRGAGLGGAEYGGDDGGGGAWTRGGCGSRSGLGWPQSTTLDRDNLPGGVTHLCPRGPVATGLGPEWSEERDVARARLERVEGADIRRAGPNGPAGQQYVVGSEWYADPDHGSDG